MIDGIHSISGIGGPSAIESLDFLKKHLEKYDKKDLIQLVMKFAPQDFIAEIHNREVRNADAVPVFNEAESKIQGFFKEDRLLMDPAAMEEALMAELNALKGLENRISDKIGSLLLVVIRGIEDAFNEGYLYVDHYYNDDYFESEEFCEYVIAFVRQLPFKDRISYILYLDQALNEMSYTTFDAIGDSYARFFRKDEMSALKEQLFTAPGFPDSMVSRIYGLLEPELNPHEKEVLLRRVSSRQEDHFISLCILLNEQQRFLEVFDLIKEHLAGRNYLEDSRIILNYLDAADALDMLTEEIAEEAVEKSPRSEVLHRIKELKGATGTRCEEIVKQWQASELLAFYEEENRLENALALVQEPEVIYDRDILAFFKKYRNEFPLETVEFLLNRIYEKLQHTGKHYYDEIAESLDLLKRVNPDRAGRIADEIRLKYKRRSNLMSRIRGY
ncbi:MAG: hypothetical protein V2B15_14515 [Bacteroidota bacterium]